MVDVIEKMLRAYYGVSDTSSRTTLIAPASPQEAMQAAAKVLLDDQRECCPRYSVLMHETHETAKEKRHTHHDCEKMIWAVRAFLDAYEKDRK